MITGLAAFSGGSVGSLTYQISPRDGIRFMTSPRGETGLRQNRPKRDPRRSPQRLENRSSGTEAEMRSSSFCLLLLPNDLSSTDDMDLLRLFLRKASRHITA